MTFLSASWLVLLLAPCAVLVAYLLVQRARQRVVVRFTSVDLLSSVVPRRSGWQRHIAAGMLLVALVFMSLAVARPAWSERIAKERATIVIALDTSASMSADDVTPSRLTAAERQARTFVGDLPSGLQVGLVTFDQGARVVVSPTQDRDTVLAALQDLPVGQGTATGDAIYLALDAVAALPADSQGQQATAAIVLLSDGTPTIGRGDQTPAETVDAAAAAAEAAGVPVNTIAFGTPAAVIDVQGRSVPVPSDPAAMQHVAELSGGRFFTAETANQLKSVYDQITRAVGFEVHKHELTAWFTGIALAMALLAAAASLVWSQRIA
jgi:Ca-activated chloride channel family protein